MGESAWANWKPNATGTHCPFACRPLPLIEGQWNRSAGTGTGTGTGTSISAGAVGVGAGAGRGGGGGGGGGGSVTNRVIEQPVNLATLADR